MGLLRRHKRASDADVQFLVPAREPNATSNAQVRGLLDLPQAKQIAVEAPRPILAVRRRGDLYVIQPQDRRSLPWRVLTPSHSMHYRASR